MKDTEKLARLRMIRTKTIGPVTFSILLNRFGNGIDALAAIPELTRRSGVKTVIASKSSVEKEIEEAERIGAKIVVKGEDDYPASFLPFDDAPGCVTMLGHPHLAQKTSLAMVGSRNASINALAYGEDMARQLSRHGYVIASGLARGIDAACHAGALEHGTIAVLAGGIDQVYPRENENLYHSIAESGLIITEMPLGMPATARLFPIRNRLIASISIATIVVEASLRSGSLITARDAAERGRDVLAIPGNPIDERSTGCNTLIRDGAHLVRNIDDILQIIQHPELSGIDRMLPEPKSIILPEKYSPEDVAETRKILEEHLSFDATEVDELIRRCHFSASVVNVALLELELAGLVRRLYGNKVVKVYSPENL